jgi:hypothetical protein
MKINKKIVALSVSGLVGIVGLVASSGVFAYQGDYTKKGPNYTTERHEAMTKAFESSDYDSWKELMSGKGRVTQVINKDNFGKFAEAHNLAMQGNYDEANKIRQELGLRSANGERMGASYGQGKGQGFGRAQR